jgi:putative phage-type endonuclease
MALTESWTVDNNEWALNRLGRIGGSEIGAVLGLSPYKSRVELWQEKTGMVKSKSISHLPHVRRGIEAEPIARKLIEEKFRVTYTTPQIKHERYPFVVSLDGLCKHHVLEIKTMGEAKHLDVKRGVIPDYYIVQVQWGMMLAGRKLGLFASYRPEDGTLYHKWIFEDKRLQRDMCAEALAFCRRVQQKKKPIDLVYNVI